MTAFLAAAAALKPIVLGLLALAVNILGPKLQIDKTALGAAINKALAVGLTAGTAMGFVTAALQSLAGSSATVFLDPATAAVVTFLIVHLASLVATYKGVMFHPIYVGHDADMAAQHYHPMNPLQAPTVQPSPAPTTAPGDGRPSAAEADTAILTTITPLPA